MKNLRNFCVTLLLVSSIILLSGCFQTWDDFWIEWDRSGVCDDTTIEQAKRNFGADSKAFKEWSDFCDHGIYMQ